MDNEILKDEAFFFDFHVHSIYSNDSILKPETIIQYSKKKGLSGVAISDHNTIIGAEKTKSISNKDFLVIMAAEIETEICEIIGLFLNEEVKSNKFYEVIDEIKDQDGMIILPHPFKNSILNPELIIKEIDLIEGLNARIKPELNYKARILAEKFDIPTIAGSDAHTSFEIGTVQNKLPINELNIEEIRTVLLKGLTVCSGMESPGYIRMLSHAIGRYKRGGVFGIMNSIYNKIGK